MIKLTTKSRIQLVDFTIPTSIKHGFIKPGEYELIRVPSPFNSQLFWLKIKGTNIGAVEGWWHDFDTFLRYNIHIIELPDNNELIDTGEEE